MDSSDVALSPACMQLEAALSPEGEGWDEVVVCWLTCLHD
jgi:hypothetical protein